MAKEKSLKTFDLCSESTGRENFAVGSDGIEGEVTEKAKASSLAETPCMELPGSFSMSVVVLGIVDAIRLTHIKVNMNKTERAFIENGNQFLTVYLIITIFVYLYKFLLIK